jgi:NTP pyrophosphatase (non-canonical NTP hydrolase)
MNNVERFRKIASELGDLYEKKNKAYGNSFGETYNKLGIISAVTRISDKYNRLCNLVKNPDIDNIGESVGDTLGDMACYCIMTLMEMEKATIVGMDMQGNIIKKGDLSD